MEQSEQHVLQCINWNDLTSVCFFQQASIHPQGSLHAMCGVEIYAGAGSYCYNSLQYKETQSHPTVTTACSTRRLSLILLLQQPAVQGDSVLQYC